MPASESLQAHLKFDTGTHSGIIHSLLPARNGRHVVTAALDQTIRIWDVATHTALRKILGQIGPGQVGQVQGLALSPDDRILAAHVNMAEEGSPSHSILRFYDLDSGNLLNVFDHGGTLSSIDYSPDGRYLAVGDISTRNIFVYEAGDVLKPGSISPVFTLPNQLQPFGVRFFMDGSQHRLVSGDWDLHNNQHQATLYSLKDKSRKEIPLAEFGAPEYFAISHRHIAVCSHHTRLIWILDRQFNPLIKIESGPHPAGLTFSPDGRYLLAGANSSGPADPSTCCIYDADQDYRQVRAYNGHDSIVRAVAYLGPTSVITAGGSSFDLHFWNPQTGEAQHIIPGAGKVMFAVGWKGPHTLGFGTLQHDQPDRNNLAPLQKSFDLSDFCVRPLQPDQAGGFQRVNDHWHDLSLEIFTQGNINLYVKPLMQCLTWGIEPGWYYPEVFGFCADGAILTGARGGWLRAYLHSSESYGVPRYLNGHTGTIWDLAIQGDWLATASADQTLRLWYLPDVLDATRQEDIHPALNIFIARDDEWIVWSESGFYTASMHGDRYIGFHISQGAAQEALFYPSDRFIKTLYRPALIRAILETGSEARALAKLGLRPADIGEILPPVIELLSPPATTTANPNAVLKFEVRPARAVVERIWILHNDQVLWKASGAEVRSGGKFEVPISLFPGENRYKILADGAAAKSLPALAVWTQQDDESAAWPAEEMSFGMPVSDQPPSAPNLIPQSITLKFEVPARPGEIVQLEITRNGDPIWQHSGRPKARLNRYRVPIALQSATETLEVWEKSASAPRRLMLVNVESPQPETLAATGRVVTSRGSGAAASSLPVGKTELPNLYLLAIGVSSLAHPAPELNFENLDYAHIDATAIAEKFLTQENRLYRTIHSRLLINAQATKAAIETALAEMVDEITHSTAAKPPSGNTPRDLTVVFLSGHGVDVDGEFYFWSHDFSIKDPKATGIRLMDLGSLITSLPTEIIFLVDTCRSGMVGQDLIRNIDPEVLAKYLISINERAQYILSATEKDKLSFEDSLYGHGYFTQGILDCFKNKIDVTPLQLADFVQERVRIISSGDQIPVVRTYGEIYRRSIYRK